MSSIDIMLSGYTKEQFYEIARNFDVDEDMVNTFCAEDHMDCGISDDDMREVIAAVGRMIRARLTWTDIFAMVKTAYAEVASKTAEE